MSESERKEKRVSWMGRPCWDESGEGVAGERFQRTRTTGI
jgi:hypothetical protein